MEHKYKHKYKKERDKGLKKIPADFIFAPEVSGTKQETVAPV